MADRITDKLNVVINDNLALLDEEAFSALERRIVQLRDRAGLMLRSSVSERNRVPDRRVFAGIWILLHKKR